MIKIFRQSVLNTQIYVEAVVWKLNTWFAITTTAIALLGEASSTKRTTRYTTENYSAQELGLADIGIV